jgi:hypothetical protein
MNGFDLTTWQNPTDHTVRFVLFGDRGCFPVEIPPGKEIQLSSDYDRAVRTERGGVVVGGLAPQLHKKGAEVLPVHDAIQRAAEMGALERELGRRGANFSPEALVALAAAKNESVALQKEKEALQRRLAELEAKSGIATPSTEAPRVDPPAPAGAPKGDPSAAAGSTAPPLPSPPGGGRGQRGGTEKPAGDK